MFGFTLLLLNKIEGIGCDNMTVILIVLKQLNGNANVNVKNESAEKGA